MVWYICSLKKLISHFHQRHYSTNKINKTFHMICTDFSSEFLLSLLKESLSPVQLNWSDIVHFSENFCKNLRSKLISGILKYDNKCKTNFFLEWLLNIKQIPGNLDIFNTLMLFFGILDVSLISISEDHFKGPSLDLYGSFPIIFQAPRTCKCFFSAGLLIYPVWHTSLPWN